MDWYYWYVLKLQVVLFWKSVFKIGIWILIAMGIDTIMNRSIHYAGFLPIYELIVQIVLYVLLYLGIMRRIVFNEYEKELWNQGLKKLCRRKNFG